MTSRSTWIADLRCSESRNQQRSQESAISPDKRPRVYECYWAHFATEIHLSEKSAIHRLRSRPLGHPQKGAMGVIRPSQIRLLNVQVAIQAPPHTENQRLAVVLSR